MKKKNKALLILLRLKMESLKGSKEQIMINSNFQAMKRKRWETRCSCKRRARVRTAAKRRKTCSRI